MKKIQDIHLASNQYEVLNELKQKLLDQFAVESIALYGSAVRGEANAESDLDLLILTTQKLKRTLRHQITDLVFALNLHYGTNISTVVVDRSSWETGVFSVLPFREEVLKNSISL